jgi:tRNA pseudouridine38-40 synthase
MGRIVLGIEYDGASYAGWQRQRHALTVQESVETAVARVADEGVDVVCAGRTDAGVHALEQVVHFDTSARRELRSWVLGINANLPDDIRVLWARELDEDFHSRYSAIARFYHYVILNRPMRSALQPRQTTWSFYPLDEARMQSGADYLIGEHDFSSFRAQGCQSNSPWRIMHFIRLRREGDRVIMDICANAFLHHMVRNIAGVLMEVGCGKREPEWVKELLEVRDRNQGGVTAPPDGLYLGGIYYPERFGLPRHAVFDWLPEGVTRHVPQVFGQGDDSSVTGSLDSIGNVYLHENSR